MDEPLRHHVESLFRAESRRLTAVLTRILGAENLELAEDVVQESFVAALSHWARTGLPANPEGWLLTTARNRAIDAIRRERTRRSFAPDLVKYLDSEWTLARTVDDAFRDTWANDDQLRMIFMCCAPKIEPENRLPLILKTLCGLSVPAIARGLLTSEAAINKRLYRTRQSLKNHDFRVPEADELATALPTVHAALYLVFNEGCFPTANEPILRELCRDAITLTRLLVETPEVSNSDTVALLSLMSFAMARLPSRIDSEQSLVPLDRQDRSAWDGALIEQGFRLLRRSAAMDAVRASQYHLEAAIGARHCSARQFESTDWASICNLYDRLLEVAPSASTRLNRAVAISYRDGPMAALPMVEELQASGALRHSHFLAATLGNLYRRAGMSERASHWFAAALARVETDHERHLIEQQMARAPD